SILLAMLVDESAKIRMQAANLIEKIRQTSGEAVLIKDNWSKVVPAPTTNAQIRQFRKPNNHLTFTSVEYHQMIHWDQVIVTEPPITKGIPIEELLCFESPDFPCHGQKIEQTVKLVSQVCKSISDPAKQQADAQIIHSDRKSQPYARTKSDFI